MSPDTKISNPLVSVVMATYNRAHLLPRAINSVLNQTYHNFELIIVDDGSTDNTEEVVNSFTDNRIIYHRHEENRGVLAARNTGWDLAKGKYECHLDDDDEFLPEALATAVNKLIELSPQGVQIVWFDCIDVETARFSGFGVRKEGYISYEDILCNRIGGNYWQVCDMDLVGGNRYDERLWGAESILYLKLYRKAKVYYVPQVLVKRYQKHGERICTPESFLKHLPRTTLTAKTFLEEYGEEIKPLCPRYYGQNLAGLGFYQILNGEKAEGRKTLRQAFKFYFSLKYLVLYLLSFILNKNQIVALYSVYARLLGLTEPAAIALNRLKRVVSRSKASRVTKSC